MNFLLRFSGIKGKFVSAEATKKAINKVVDNEHYNLPEKMGLKLVMNEGIKVYSYNGDIENSQRYLLYIHGGSYFEQAISYQIKFAQKVAERTKSTLIFPVYTLVPKGNYKKMYDDINKIYIKLLNMNKEINFLGDSAGGGFILSYSMYLRDNNVTEPKNLLMLSPWMDLTLENEEIKKMEKKDPLNAIAGNIYAGELWADNISTKNYLVSPLYGEFNDLPKITMMVGGHDILKPDSIELSKKLDDLHIEYNYIEYKNQGHIFGVHPIKESRLLIEDIASILDKNNE